MAVMNMRKMIRNFYWMRSSLLVSLDAKLFHAVEAYTSLDPTKVKYNIKRVSRDEKEKL
jgi:hypothetical protein